MRRLILPLLAATSLATALHADEPKPRPVFTEDGTVKVPAYLAGTCELSNRSNGHRLPAKVYDAESGAVLEGLALPAPKGEVVPIMAALAERMRAGGAR